MLIVNNECIFHVCVCVCGRVYTYACLCITKHIIFINKGHVRIVLQDKRNYLYFYPNYTARLYGRYIVYYSPKRCIYVIYFLTGVTHL